MIFCSAHASKRMPLDAAAQPISFLASEEAPAGTGRSWFNSRVCDYCFQAATTRKPSLRRKSTRTTSALAPEVIGVDEDEADAPTLRDHSSAFRKLRSRASHDSTQAVVGSFQRLCEVPFPPAREVVPWRCDEAWHMRRAVRRARASASLSHVRRIRLQRLRAAPPVLPCVRLVAPPCACATRARVLHVQVAAR